MTHHASNPVLRHSLRALLGRPPAAFAMLGLPGIAMAGPIGGDVIRGQADITRPDANNTIIHQYTDRAVINWQSFNVDTDEYVIFNQLDASSIVLNRVLGGDTSYILGHIEANGQVFLLNPNGVFFTHGASLDVQGFLASTLDMNPDSFMNGDLTLTRSPGAPASAQVINDGHITAGPGGYVVLAGDYTGNTGIITANAGTVALVSGNALTLDIQGDGLVSFTVDEATLSEAAGVHNAGSLIADGGRVIMTAKVAGNLVASAVNNEGLVRAHSIEQRGGEIYLVGYGGDVSNSGTLDADGENANGGGIAIYSDRDITLADGGVQTAAGDANHEGGVIRAIAEEHLDYQQDNLVRVSGGPDSHRGGGFVEVSGHGSIALRGTPDVGSGGTYFIDPSVINIVTGGSSNSAGTLGVDAIVAQLEAGVDVILAASSSITATSVPSLATAGSATGNLTIGIGSASPGTNCGAFGLLCTAPDIFIPNGNGTINLGSMDISIGGNVTIDAGTTGVVTTVNITTSDGNVTIYGGTITTGTITAMAGTNAGDITLGDSSRIASQVVVNGNLSADGNVESRVREGSGLFIDINGNITAGAVVLDAFGSSMATGEIAVSGLVDATSNVSIAAGGSVNGGSVSLGDVQAGGNIDIATTALGSGPSVVGDITTGDISGGVITVSAAGGNVTIAGNINAGGDVSISAANSNNSATARLGTVLTTQNVTIDAAGGVIGTDLVIGSTGQYANLVTLNAPLEVTNSLRVWSTELNGASIGNIGSSITPIPVVSLNTTLITSGAVNIYADSITGSSLHIGRSTSGVADISINADIGVTGSVSMYTEGSIGADINIQAINAGGDIILQTSQPVSSGMGGNISVTSLDGNNITVRTINNAFGGGNFTATGNLLGTGSINVDVTGGSISGGNIGISGSVLGSSTVNLEAIGTGDSQGRILVGGNIIGANLTLTARNSTGINGGMVTASGGAILVSGVATITASGSGGSGGSIGVGRLGNSSNTSGSYTLMATGLGSGGNITMSSAHADALTLNASGATGNSAGTIRFGSTINVSGNVLMTASGGLNGGGDISGSGTITANNFTATATGGSSFSGGSFDLVGDINVTNNVSITATGNSGGGNINVGNVTAALGDISFTANGGSTSSGSITAGGLTAAAGRIDLQAAGSISATGSISAGGNVEANANSGNINIQNVTGANINIGATAATGSVTVTTGTLDATGSGSFSGNAIVGVGMASTGTGQIVTGNITAANDIKLSVGSFPGAPGNGSITAGTLNASDELRLWAPDDITMNALTGGPTIMVLADSVTINGAISGTDLVDIDATSVIEVTGSISADSLNMTASGSGGAIKLESLNANALTLTGQLLTVGGDITITGGNLSLGSIGSLSFGTGSHTVTATGNILLTGSLNITGNAASVDYVAGGLASFNLPGGFSAGDIDADTVRITANSGGVVNVGNVTASDRIDITAGGTVSITTGMLAVTGSGASGTGDMSILVAPSSSTASISADLDIAGVTDARNVHIINDAVNGTQQFGNFSGIDGQLVIDTETAGNVGIGDLSFAGSFSYNTPGTVDLLGTVNVGGNVNIHAAGINDASSGTGISADGAIMLNASGGDILVYGLDAGGDIQLFANNTSGSGSITISTGPITTGGGIIVVNASNAFGAANGAFNGDVSAFGNIGINLAGSASNTLTVGGDIAAGGSFSVGPGVRMLDYTAGSHSVNAGGGILMLGSNLDFTGSAASVDYIASGDILINAVDAFNAGTLDAGANLQVTAGNGLEIGNAIAGSNLLLDVSASDVDTGNLTAGNQLEVRTDTATAAGVTIGDVSAGQIRMRFNPATTGELLGVNLGNLAATGAGQSDISVLVNGGTGGSMANLVIGDVTAANGGIRLGVFQYSASGTGIGNLAVGNISVEQTAMLHARGDVTTGAVTIANAAGTANLTIRSFTDFQAPLGGDITVNGGITLSANSGGTGGYASVHLETPGTGNHSITVNGAITVTGEADAFEIGSSGAGYHGSGVSGGANARMLTGDGTVQVGDISLDGVLTGYLTVSGSNVTVGNIGISVAPGSSNFTFNYDSGWCGTTCTLTGSGATDGGYGRVVFENQGAAQGASLDVGNVSVIAPDAILHVRNYGSITGGDIALTGSGNHATVTSSGTYEGETVAFSETIDGGGAEMSLLTSGEGVVNLGAIDVQGEGRALVNIAGNIVNTQGIAVTAAGGTFTRSGVPAESVFHPPTLFDDRGGNSGPKIDEGTITGGRARVEISGMGTDSMSSGTVYAAGVSVNGGITASAPGNAHIRIAGNSIGVAGALTATGGHALRDGTRGHEYVESDQVIVETSNVTTSYGEAGISLEGSVAGTINAGDISATGPIANGHVEGGTLNLGSITLQGSGGDVNVVSTIVNSTTGTTQNIEFHGPGGISGMGLRASGNLTAGDITITGIGGGGTQISGDTVSLGNVSIGIANASYEVLDTEAFGASTHSFTLGGAIFDIEASSGATVNGDLDVTAEGNVHLGGAYTVDGAANVAAGISLADIDEELQYLFNIDSDGEGDALALSGPWQVSAAGIAIDAVSGGLDLAGQTLTADGNLVLNAGGSVNLAGATLDAGTLLITAAGDLAAGAGNHTASEGITLNVGGAFSTAGATFTAPEISLAGGTATAFGIVTNTARLTLGSAANYVIDNTAHTAATALSVTGNVTGSLDVATGGALTLNNDVTAAAITLDGASLDLGGRALDATGALTLLTQGALLNATGLLSAGSLAIKAPNAGGAALLTDTGDMSLEIDGTVSIDNAFTGTTRLAFAPVAMATLDVALAGDAVFAGDITADGVAIAAAGNVNLGDAALTVGTGSAPGATGDAAFLGLLAEEDLAPGSGAPGLFIRGGDVTLGDLAFSGDYLFLEANTLSFAGTVTTEQPGTLVQLAPLDPDASITLLQSGAGAGDANFTNAGHLSHFAGDTVALGTTDHAANAVIAADGTTIDIGSTNLFVLTQGAVTGLDLVLSSGVVKDLDTLINGEFEVPQTDEIDTSQDTAKGLSEDYALADDDGSGGDDEEGDEEGEDTDTDTGAESDDNELISRDTADEEMMCQ